MLRYLYIKYTNLVQFNSRSVGQSIAAPTTDCWRSAGTASGIWFRAGRGIGECRSERAPAQRYRTARIQRAEFALGGATAGAAVMNRYLRLAASMPRIYLYRDPVDFRKSYRGLAAIAEQQLGDNPLDGALYAFTNRQRNQAT